MKYSREIAKAQGIGDGNNLRYKQELIHQLANYLGEAITDLVLDNELPNAPSTWDNKIQMLQTANQLYPLIYGENLLFFHWRIAFNHWLISTYQAAQGKTEEVLSSLEKICHHALLHHQSLSDNHSKCYSSNLVNQIVCEQPYRDITEHSPCFYMLERLQEKRYDFIRKEPRFIAIETSLKEYAT